MDRAITISRQYGSGGRELGEKLAKKLGIPFYDKELIAMIAKEGNIEPSILEANDEVEPDLDNYSTRLIEPEYQIAMTQRIYAVQETVIKSLAEKGACVIVGRCADYALSDYEGAISVFIHADLDKRIKRIARKHELTDSAAKDRIQKTDKRRASYYNYYTSKKWGDATSYDLCLNSGVLGIDGCVEMIKRAIEIKEGRRAK